MSQPISNFDFLIRLPSLQINAVKAEKYVYEPEICFLYLRKLAEALALKIVRAYGLSETIKGTDKYGNPKEISPSLDSRVWYLYKEGKIKDHEKKTFDLIRQNGNDAAHTGEKSRLKDAQDALDLLEQAYYLTADIYQRLEDRRFEIKDFVAPRYLNDHEKRTAEEEQELKEEIKKIKAEAHEKLEQAQENVAALEKEMRQNQKEREELQAEAEQEKRKREELEKKSQKNFEEIMLDIERYYSTTKEKGDAFERLSIAFLKHSPRWKAEFKDVGYYTDWSGKPDKGIDLVAIRRVDGRPVAIQCKYRKNSLNKKDELDKFFTKAIVDEKHFAGRIIITNTVLKGSADETVREHGETTILITANNLEESGFDWGQYDHGTGKLKEVILLNKRHLRGYQEKALKACYNYFIKENYEAEEKRAQIQMACGTGKTFTSLMIAEKLAGAGKIVLFLAPSLTLVDQTLKDWTNSATIPINPLAVCSDKEIGVEELDAELEGDENAVGNLAFPATTDPVKFTQNFHQFMAIKDADERMTVIFCTYQSLHVIHQAQITGDGADILPEIDLVICDEAHRTAGLLGSKFSNIHDREHLKAHHRLYMTATPKIFSDDAKKNADTLVASMDDETLFGPRIFEYGFRDAVNDGWLCDYKLVFLRVDQTDVMRTLSKSNDALDQQAAALTDIERLGKINRGNIKSIKKGEEALYHLDDAARIIGCWRALLGIDIVSDGGVDLRSSRLKKAVGFCGAIENPVKVSSKKIAREFARLANQYDIENQYEDVYSKVEHVDGSMSGSEREEALNWLKRENAPGETKILMNVRCLSEGVDVPSLDAVMFLSPRSSKIDIIQAIGRVMRKSEGKDYGYIIIPYVIPDNIKDEEINGYLGRSNSGFSTLYSVIAGLRSHDSLLEDETRQIKDGTRADYSNIIVAEAAPKRGPMKSTVRKEEGGDVKQDNDDFGFGLSKRKPEPKDQGSMTTHIFDGDGYGDGESENFDDFVNNNEDKKDFKEDEKDDNGNNAQEDDTAFINNEKNASDGNDSDAEQKTSKERKKRSDAGKIRQGNLNFKKRNQAVYSTIKARLVKTLGRSPYYDDWAKDATRLVKEIIDRITLTVDPERADEDHYTFFKNDPRSIKAREEFKKLLKNIKKTLNASTTEAQLIDMLAQHIVTLPLFEAIFYNEADLIIKNPITKALHPTMEALKEAGIQALEDRGLRQFCKRIGNAVKDYSIKQKQEEIKNIYEKFIQRAFGVDAKKNGVVYTPIPVVDFILHSIEDVLKENFGYGMGEPSVHLLDPFTGTGTFVTRLLASGILSEAQLKEKYNHKKIWANEIMLLPYYISTINIEAEYHRITGEWKEFSGGVFADSFILPTKKMEGGQIDYLIEQDLKENTNRIKEQVNDEDVHVIFANPPYSAGATKAGDGTSNDAYENDNSDKIGIDKRIEETYVEYSQSTNTRHLYDSYFRALRWASDRIGDKGVIGFISNTGFLEGAAAAGVRKCLEEEFNDLYFFHLKGGIRGKKGEEAKKQGQNIFDIMTGVVIYILVKNPASSHKGKIHFYDIGDYLTRDEKFDVIKEFKSIKGISDANGWQILTPDQHHDWLNHRDDSFDNFMMMGSKDKKDQYKNKIFSNYALGLNTNRDAWVWNFSKKIVEASVARQIATYEKARALLNKKAKNKPKKKREKILKEIIKSLPKENLSWASSLENKVISNQELTADEGELRLGSYRPFTKEYIYYSKFLNHRVSKFPEIFPHQLAENKVICLTNDNATLSCLITDDIADLEFIHHAQCFPFYIYQNNEKQAEKKLFQTQQEDKTYAITDAALTHFSAAYSKPKKKITKEDLFYYIYGLLNYPDYKERFATSLAKQLPRIPRMGNEKDFWIFSKAGRDLAEIHLNYDHMAPYYALNDKTHIEVKKHTSISEEELFYVTKMKFGRKTIEKEGVRKTIPDKSKIIYNDYITIFNIDENIYNYSINGRSAVEWIMERYQIKTDKRSGITNNPNSWGAENNHPDYILSLLLKIMTLSIETQKILDALPPPRISAMREMHINPIRSLQFQEHPHPLLVA